MLLPSETPIRKIRNGIGSIYRRQPARALRQIKNRNAMAPADDKPAGAKWQS
jgi:hypothetical protein